MASRLNSWRYATQKPALQIPQSALQLGAITWQSALSLVTSWRSVLHQAGSNVESKSALQALHSKLQLCSRRHSRHCSQRYYHSAAGAAAVAETTWSVLKFCSRRRKFALRCTKLALNSALQVFGAATPQSAMQSPQQAGSTVLGAATLQSSSLQPRSWLCNSEVITANPQSALQAYSRRYPSAVGAATRHQSAVRATTRQSTLQVAMARQSALQLRSGRRSQCDHFSSRRSSQRGTSAGGVRYSRSIKKAVAITAPRAKPTLRVTQENKPTFVPAPLFIVVDHIRTRAIFTKKPPRTDTTVSSAATKQE